jgi:hypothetical protein
MSSIAARYHFSDYSDRKQRRKQSCCFSLLIEVPFPMRRANPKLTLANPKLTLANPKLMLANPKLTLANPKCGVGVIFSQSATRLRPKRFGPNFTTPQPHFGGRFDPNRLLIVPRVILGQSAARFRPSRFGPNLTTPQPHFSGRFDPNRLLIVLRLRGLCLKAVSSRAEPHYALWAHLAAWTA